MPSSNAKTLAFPNTFDRHIVIILASQLRTPHGLLCKFLINKRKLLRLRVHASVRVCLWDLSYYQEKDRVR